MNFSRNRKLKFIFDLDGTVTAQETLPLIADHFKISNDINELTKETVKGNIPFVESFIRRVNILGKLPVSEVNELLASVKLYPEVLSFIRKNNSQCIVATGNLYCWVRSLDNYIGCEFYSSEAIVENDKIVKISHIFKKENVVNEYREKGYFVVFIGEGNNDMEAMRIADISIASGLTHQPAQSVLTIADYLIYSEGALCRLLNQLF